MKLILSAFYYIKIAVSICEGELCSNGKRRWISYISECKCKYIILLRILKNIADINKDSIKKIGG